MVNSKCIQVVITSNTITVINSVNQFEKDIYVLYASYNMHNESIIHIDF